jgi:hypothetical protein
VTTQAVVLVALIVATVAWRAIGAWERVHTARTPDPWEETDHES